MLLPMRYLNLVTAALQPRRVQSTDWLVLLLACLASVYVFWDIQRPFHETDEFLYSQVVGQMLDSGDFVTPRFGSIDLLSKPPLFYWLSAIVQSLTGHEALGIRLLPGMSFILILFLIYRIGREQFSGSAGLLAALVFFLCYDHQFNHVYKAGVMEGILNLQIALVFWLNLKLHEQPGRIRWIAAIIALAFMTKSVFAVIPAAITAANVWFRRGEIRITRTHLLQAVALCAAIVLPWFLVALQRHGIELVDYMFVDQVWNRAVYDETAATETARTFGRTQPLYVLHHFLEYGQPWSLFVWPALWYSLRVQPARSRTETLTLWLCAIWFIGVMLLFLASRGRWSWYVSSTYVPAAIMIAAMFGAFRRDVGLAVAPAVWIAAAVAFLVPRAIFFVNPYSRSSGRSPIFMEFFEYGLAALIVCALVLAIRRLKLPDIHRRNLLWISIAVGIFGAIAVPLAHLLLADGPKFGFDFSGLMLPGLAAMTAIMLLLYSLRTAVAARTAVLAWPFLLASVYLIAPLRWAGQDYTQPEIASIEAKIDSGYFARNKVLEMRLASFFRYVPIYATFGDEYDVEFDAGSTTLRMSAKASSEAD